ncbi:MAG TPA: UbiD family decarboxylase, partial [Chloroflexota bacterium]|nr:UbiD family decarboxylase [Chloroflexota bacterium]
MTAGDKEWTASNTRFEGGMGIDATLPYGYESDFARPLYPVDRVDLRRWFSEADLARGQALMKGWVEVLARTGR